MTKKDGSSAMKVSQHGKDFVDNVRATRRSVIKGVSTDKKQLSQTETIDLIVNYFKSDNPSYLALIKMDYKKNA